MGVCHNCFRNFRWRGNGIPFHIVLDPMLAVSVSMNSKTMKHTNSIAHLDP